MTGADSLSPTSSLLASLLRSDRRAGFVVFVGFVVVHLVLLSGSFDVIDLEELEYGNFGVALLDGVDQPAGTFQTYPREGSRLLLEPLLWPLFAVLGSSLWTLKLFGILGAALWATLWFLLARRVVPGGARWLAVVLFLLPLPLVQRAALSTSSIFAHLGASAWYGLALLLSIGAVGRGRPWLWLIASGLAAGLGTYCGFALAPLLPGLLWLVWRLKGLLGCGLLGLGAVPGLLLVLRTRDSSRFGSQVDPVVALTGLEADGAFRASGLGGTLENLWNTVAYGAGFGVVDPSTLDLHYLPLGALYTTLIVGAVVFAWRGRVGSGTEANHAEEQRESGADRRVARELCLALAISTACYAASVVVTGFKIEIHYFDGPRYLLPLAPLPALILLWAIDRMADSWARMTWVVVLALHVLGFALLFRPAVFPAPWMSVKGFEPWVRRQFLEVPLEPESIDPQRLPRWAVWAGISASWSMEPKGHWPDWEGLDGQHKLDGLAQEEFWRGFGVGLLLSQEHQEERTYVPAEAPDDVRLLVWEGLAMGYSNAGCQERVRAQLLEVAPADHQDALWYGFGRADVYCKNFLPGLPDEADQDAFRRGHRDGWVLDFWSGYSTPDVPDSFINDLKVY
ncbi:MAG TPA: hypothetical protein DIU15_14725 [Deltaproteobacteria bacterium]|nr:hypothetical protein [Deltaproteobacteria bacterium]HCP47293.1 hypothetical protein [Deltaproteobacteria bacterium]